MEEAKKLKIDKERCNRDIRTYGDVIRHMDNLELALFFEEIQAEIELGVLAVMRAKMYYHRNCGEEPVMSEKDDRHKIVSSFNHFMEHRLKYEPERYADVWGVENYQDLMQWTVRGKLNFGMDVVY